VESRNLLKFITLWADEEKQVKIGKTEINYCDKLINEYFFVPLHPIYIIRAAP
jgi:hypothetical protein